MFKDFTNEEFVCFWDGVPYRFPAGKEMYVEDWKAEHFAKHLVNKVIYKSAGKELILTDQVLRNKLLAQALPGGVTVTPDEALDINVREEVAEKEEEVKKEIKKKKTSKKVVEEEFEGLKAKK